MPRFFGRHVELAALRAAIDSAKTGRGGLVLIAGEPGIGKTRLAQEVEAYAAERGVSAIWGRSVELEGTRAYWPWIQVLREIAARDVGGNRLREACEAVAEIAQIVPEFGARSSPPRSRPHDTGDRFRLFDAVGQVFRWLTASQPLIVLLDDLQWCDGGSLALLRHLSRDLHDLPLLVVGIYRDANFGRRSALAAVLPELARERGASRFRLSGLDESDIARYVQDASGSEPAPGLVRAIHEQTGGNPFYVGELCRLVAEEGELLPGALPLGVREVIGRRLDLLSDECHHVLGVASVLGRTFDLNLLAALIRAPISSLLGLLDEAVAVHLIERRGSPRTYGFAHDLVRESLYQELPARARVELHQEVAQLLERQGAAGRLPELAHHWYEAVGGGSWEKAVDYATRASEEAMDQMDYEEAARLRRLALDSLPLKTPDLLQRWQLLHDLAEAQYRAGTLAASLKSCAAAAAVARELRRGDLVARSVLVIQDVAPMPLQPTLQGLCESALAAIGDDYPALRAQLLAQLARILDTMSRPERNDALSREAVELANLSRDPDALVAAIYARHTLASLPDGIEERLALGTRLIELATGGVALSHAAWGRLWRIDAHFQSGDFHAIPGELADLEAIVNRLRQPLFHWHLLRTRAALAQATGRFAEALPDIEEALRVWGPEQHPMTAVFHRWMRAEIGIELGRPELIEGAVALHEHVPIHMRPSFGALEVRTQTAVGREDSVKDLFHELVALLPSRPQGREWLFRAAFLAEAAVDLGSDEERLRLRQALTPYRELFVASGAGAVGCYGSVARFLGLLGAAMERWDDAARDLEHGLNRDLQAGAAPYAARGQLSLAQVEARRAMPVRALELARSAARNARRLGMRPLQERAERFVRDLERGGPRLSRREADVAAMVARGLSNRAVAESMHLSVRTVENHVQRILDKLAFASRSQIAVWAVKEGLVRRQEIEYRA